jgi:hypothetical protein
MLRVRQSVNYRKNHHVQAAVSKRKAMVRLFNSISGKAIIGQRRIAGMVDRR